MKANASLTAGTREFVETHLVEQTPQQDRTGKAGGRFKFGSSYVPLGERFITSLPAGLRRSSACFAVVAILNFAQAAVAQQREPPGLQRIDRNGVCVTNGAVAALPDGRLAVETRSSRAVVQARTDNAADQTVEIHFQYLGPSRDTKPLASGELRRQIGMKLRAQDSCNLIYAMWHIEPDTRVAVSIKRNPGLHTHEQCGAHGYVNLKSQAGTGSPPMHPGETHSLRAELHGKELNVIADGKVAWQGSLGATVLPVGPPGFRTDNARFAFDYFTEVQAGSPPTAQHTSPGRGQCEISEGD
jgi:hypothetical protein